MLADTTIDLDSAFDRVASEVGGFIKNPRETPLCFRVNGGETLHFLLGGASVMAIAVATGVGKTTAIVEQIAAIASEKRKLLVLVPRHELGEDIANQLRERNITATVLRGRDANDPDNPGHKMCLDLQAVKDAQGVGEPVESSCCKDREYECPFFNQCGYQQRKRSDPMVWIATHEYLTQDPDIFGDVEFVFVDESFWQTVTVKLPLYFGRVNSKGLTLGEIDGMSHSAMEIEVAKRQLVTALRDHITPDYLPLDQLIPVEQHLLIEAGLTANLCDKVAWAALKAAEHIPLQPGMPARERAKLIKAASRTRKHAGQIARMWQAAADLLRQDYGSRSGRLFIRADDRTVHVQSGPNINEKWRKMPMMLADATLPPRDLLNHFFPLHKIIRQVANVTNVEMPLTHIRHVLNSPTSKTKLEQDVNLQALRRYVIKRWIETGRGETLVICSKAAAEKLAATDLPKQIRIRHFNNVTGMNDAENVELLVVAGRPQPQVRAVELLAGAITGVMPVEAQPEGGRSPSFQRITTQFRARDGSERFASVARHPDPIVEAVRWQICEAEVLQAIGRARAVRRGRTGIPLQIDVLSNVVLPFAVDQVQVWDEAKVGRELTMIENGMILDSAADITRCWKDEWPNAKSAENWRRDFSLPALIGKYIIGEGGRNQSRWIAIRYRPIGRGQQWRSACFDPSIITEPRSWIEQRIGALAGFEMG